MSSLKENLIRMAVDEKTPDENLKLALQVLANGQHIESEEDERFISIKEALEFAGGINRVTLFRWCKRGLPSYKVGQRRLFRKSELRDFIIKSNTI